MNKTKTKIKRSGFTIAETAVAIAILGIALGVGLQIMATTAAAEARFQRRQLAIQETQNQLERIETLAWEELTDEVSKSIVLSDVAQEQLKSPEVTVQIDEEKKTEETPEAKRVVVALTWQEPNLEKPSTVQLVTWRYFDHNQKDIDQ